MRKAPAENYLIAQDQGVSWDDIDVPNFAIDWPDYLEEKFSEKGVNPGCAHCPHADHHADFVSVGDQDEHLEYYKVKAVCRNFHHVCPSEAGYNEHIAELTLAELDEIKELSEFTSELDADNGIGDWS